MPGDISTELFFEQLRPWIGCPEQWERFQNDWEMRRVLFLYWAEVAEQHQVGWDMSNYRQSYAIHHKWEETLRSARLNSEYWRPRAVSIYQKQTFLFKTYRHADIREHAKHWPVAGQTVASIVSSTINGPAKYFSDVSLDFLRIGLDEVVRLNWRRIIDQKPSSLYGTAGWEVGASGGRSTRYVRFYLDYSTGIVHSRPILEEEKPPDEPWSAELNPALWHDVGDFFRAATIDEPVEWL